MGSALTKRPGRPVKESTGVLVGKTFGCGGCLSGVSCLFVWIQGKPEKKTSQKTFWGLWGLWPYFRSWDPGVPCDLPEVSMTILGISLTP